MGEKQMKQQYTLREFIDETSAESYHGTATKRFVLANLFIKKYGYLLGKHANTKEDKKERANFVYIGLDSVSFTVDKQKNKYFYSFKPIVPPSTDKKELKELKFNNYSYLSPNYAKECKNEEYLSCYEVSEHCKYSKIEAAQVISVILFAICIPAVEIIPTKMIMD